MRSHRGYTLIELLVAMAMALVVLTAIIRVFWFGRKVERQARSAYLITADADVAFRKVQEDLRLTHLGSIRVDGQGGGFSMISPLENNDRSTFALSDYGTARWKTWVHYTVTGQTDVTGNLVRWEAPYTGTNPVPSTFKPTQIGSPKWSLLSGVTLPGVKTSEGTDAEKLRFPKMGINLADNGGLQLRFVRREGDSTVLSSTNPVEKSDKDTSDWSKGTTQLVDCRLQVADKSTESGRWSIYTLNFRVEPRN